MQAAAVVKKQNYKVKIHGGVLIPFFQLYQKELKHRCFLNIFPNNSRAVIGIIG